MVRRILFIIDLNRIVFNTQKTYSTGLRSFPLGLAVADVNNDNKPDIVVANNNENNVGVLLNDGQGTFLSQTTYSIGKFSKSEYVSIGDINDDDKPDIIVRCDDDVDCVGFLLNYGNGTFHAPGFSSFLKILTVADINNDNHLDIIIANENEKKVSVIFIYDGFKFSPQTNSSFLSIEPPEFLTVADINGDSKPDIVFVNQLAHTVGVLFGFGNGTFHSLTTYLTGDGSYPKFVSVVDVNQDDKPDIIVVNHRRKNVGVFLNYGDGTFPPQTIYSTRGDIPRCLSVVDLNGDNKPEIIVANQGSNDIDIFVNIGYGQFYIETTYSTGLDSRPVFISVVDVNGDDKLDIIVANGKARNVGVLLAA
jgi:hypothetical protein